MEVSLLSSYSHFRPLSPAVSVGRSSFSNGCPPWHCRCPSFSSLIFLSFLLASFSFSLFSIFFFSSCFYFYDYLWFATPYPFLHSSLSHIFFLLLLSSFLCLSLYLSLYLSVLTSFFFTLPLADSSYSVRHYMLLYHKGYTLALNLFLAFGTHRVRFRRGSLWKGYHISGRHFPFSPPSPAGSVLQVFTNSGPLRRFIFVLSKQLPPPPPRVTPLLRYWLFLPFPLLPLLLFFPLLPLLREPGNNFSLSQLFVNYLRSG